MGLVCGVRPAREACQMSEHEEEPMRRITPVVLAVGVGAVQMCGGARPAAAQYRAYKGRVLVSQKKPPAKPEALRRWMRKETTTRLKSEKGGGKWLFHFAAVLRKRPPVDVVNLVYYEYRGGGFKYINAEDVRVSAGANLIVGKGKMYKILGFKRGKRYQVRITIKDARGREIIYAKSRLLLLK
jgi:hypothetical protein